MSKTRRASAPPPPLSGARSTWVTAFAVFAIALALRALHIWQIRRAPFFDLLLEDAAAYDAWARRVAAGDWLGRAVFYQAPLYPYFLGLVYRFLGTDVMTVRLVQAVLSAASCALVGDAARRLFGRRTGLVAGLLLACYPPAIFLDTLIQKSAVDLFCLSIVLWLVARLIADDRGQSLWLWLGVALGFLSLTRENAALLVVPLVVWLAVQRGLPHRARAAALLVAGLAVVLAPVAVRNRLVGHEWVLTTAQFGPNLYIGNNEHADGTYRPLRPFREKPEYERSDAVDIAEQAAGRPLTAGEVSAYYTDQVIAFVRARPGAWLRLMGRKLLLAWNAVEVGDTEDQYTDAEWSWPLALGRVWNFGVLAPLAALGIWITAAEWRRLWLLHLMLATYVASLVLFYVFARYRFPIVPFLMLFAAAGLVRAGAFVRSGRGRLAACAATIAAVAIVANLPMVAVPQLEAATRYNIGVGLQNRGDQAGALAEYQAATALDPALPVAHTKLGLLLAADGRNAEAVPELEQAFHLAPSATVANNLAVALARLGRTADAIADLRAAVALDPRYGEAYRNLASLLASTGRSDEAIAALATATALDPADAGLRSQYAGLLARAGRLADAAAQLRAAIQAAPTRADLHNNLGIVLAARGDAEEAAAEFRRALALDPGNAEAARNLDRIRALVHPARLPNPR